MKTHKQTIYIALKSTHQSRRISLIQGSHYLLILKFKDFQDPSNFIFKDQFSTEVYSMSSRTALFNVYLCDDGTVIR